MPLMDAIKYVRRKNRKKERRQSVKQCYVVLGLDLSEELRSSSER